MFLRWITRVKGSMWIDKRMHDLHLRAVLVEAYRANGKPRQRQVYLGGITQKKGIAHPLLLCQFWQKVGQRLDEQGARLSPAARRRIEKAIAAKVPRLTKRQRAQVARQWPF